MSKQRRKVLDTRRQDPDKQLKMLLILTLLSLLPVPPTVLTLLHFAKKQNQSPLLMIGFAGFQMFCCLAVLLINWKNIRVWRLVRNATPDDQITHIRTVLRRLLAMNALVLSVTIALLIYVSGLYNRFSGVIGAKLAWVASTVISGLIGNFAYELMKKVLGLGPTFGDKKR